MLLVASWAYGGIVRIRNSFYERGIFRAHNLGAYTVSVGNLTAGGTGKTPLTAYIAAKLSGRGENVCVISRGYGRLNENRRVLVSDGNEIFVSAIESGDEPQELARKLIGKAVVVADADRVSAAKWAISEYGTTAFVLDDAFQHRGVRRTVDIVCIDAVNPFGGGKMLPAGRLREPVSGLDHAGIAVITRANLVDDLSGLKNEIFRIAPKIEIFTAANRISKFRSINDALKFESSMPLMAFSALGNPQNFIRQLELENLKIVNSRSFPDHHFYTQSDIEALESEAKSHGAGALITTAKDSVKLVNLDFNLPCFVAEIEVEVSDENRFLTLI